MNIGDIIKKWENERAIASDCIRHNAKYNQFEAGLKLRWTAINFTIKPVLQ